MSSSVDEHTASRIREAARAGAQEGEQGEPVPPGQPGEPEPEEPDAEPVEPTVEPPADPEPETEQEPPPGATSRSGEPSDSELRAFAKEQERHEAALHRIMGDDVADWQPCEDCNGVGLVPPGPRPLTHAFFQTCATCGGYGQVLTGSLRPGNELRDCPGCAGRGYLEALNEQGSPLASSPASPVPIAPPAPPVAQPPADANGGQATSPPRFGVPAWMGDPTVGQ